MSTIAVPDWTRFAGCAGADPLLFFGADDETARDRQVREAKAIAICRTCPVRRQCLEHALSQKSQHGVAGGVGEERRAALRNAWLKRQKRAEGKAA